MRDGPRQTDPTARWIGAERPTQPPRREAGRVKEAKMRPALGFAGATAHVVALAGLAALAVGWMVLMSALPRSFGTETAPGLGEPAEIGRDSRGVAHIRAGSAHDAYYALGWAHAQDRLAQMDLSRRLAAGRLAEAIGPAGLGSDRFMRTLGLYRRAERAFPALDEPTRAALIAYAAGVNAWLAAHRARLPLEFRVLGVGFEPWRPADSLVWQKLMALTLAGDWTADLVRGQLARRLDARRLRELFPAMPPAPPPPLADGGEATLLALLPEPIHPAPASNVWAVGGSRTRSGRPLLANDPHLEFGAPIQWYLATIDTPGLSLAGATVPGVPFHVIGHNHTIAWGFTSAQADTIDLFVEKLAGPTAYRTPEGARPFVTRDEVIRVKGGADVHLVVRETRHGPVISDLAEGGPPIAEPGEVVAFAATALVEDDLGLQALRRLGVARDWPGFVDALRDLRAPALNVAYADTAGRIGVYTAGRIPVRRSGNGLVPVRGWTGEGDWTGSIPFAHLPHVYLPRADLLINANDPPAGSSPRTLIAATWPDAGRANRLAALLGPTTGLAAEDMVAIQGDVVSPTAADLKDLLEGMSFAAPASAEAARRLLAWDGAMERDRPEPLIFAAWAEHLNRALFADELGPLFEALGPAQPRLLLDALTRYRHWCDDITTPAAESCEEMIERSLTLAVADLGRVWGTKIDAWRWGAAHRARFDAPVLGRIPGLGRLADLSIETGGSDGTVNRGSARPVDGATRFEHRHGPGLRVVFDLADLDRSLFLIATGQSGQPFSPHYADQLADWRDNRPHTLAPGPRGATLVLRPQPGLASSAYAPR